MKTFLLLSVVAVGLQQVDVLLDSLNAWVEFGIKVAGLAAAVGGAWRWLVGPGYRRVRGAVEWAGEQLELIGELGERLESIEAELGRGHDHFLRLDAALEAMTTDEARAVRRAILTGEPVQFTEAGGVDRREPVSDTSA